MKNLLNRVETNKDAAAVLKDGRLHNAEARDNLARYIVRVYGAHAGLEMATLMATVAKAKIRDDHEKANAAADATAGLLDSLDAE